LSAVYHYHQQKKKLTALFTNSPFRFENILKSMITKNNFFRFRIWFTAIISTVLLGLLLWQYFNGGIPSHHFLDDETLPLVSNAWGALVIPIITWFLLFRVEKRLFSQSDAISFPRQSLSGFLSALVFGLVLGVAVVYGFETFLSYIPLILFSLALFFPTYKAEYFLGFILGLTYFIGGVLPVVVGSIFLLISAAIYLLIRPLILKLVRMIKK